MADAPTARERLAELYAKVDAFFDRAAAALPGPSGITCHTGCDACCRRRFSVTAIEAEVIAEALAALSPEQREALARRAIEGDPGVCPALDSDGRCALYAARPLICRTHGLAIRFAGEADTKGGRSLPVLDTCPKNFAGRDLAALPATLVLDQSTLSTVLGALDAARAAEVGRERGKRFEIAELLAGAA
jgi:Fe-S-cluster containining protein